MGIHDFDSEGLNIRIELSETDCQEIIAKYLKEKGYSVVYTDIEFSIKTRTEGYGMAEHGVPYFEAAYVKCKEKKGK